MKAKHLLAALVLPAVFSACSQDELVTNSVDKEVVGTPIGYLEFTASRSGATTRLADTGWEEGDKIGMGWISSGNDLPATANLFSNHPIYYRGDKGSFKSETMIYEGLYIASFPFQTTQKIAPLVFDLTKQKSEDSYYSKRWNVSGTFIELTEKTAGLGNATAINLVPLTNLMKLNIKLPVSSSAPADLKITGVTLDDGGNGKLVNKLTLKSDAGGSAIAKGKSALVAACWTGVTGNIEVQVGEDKVGAAIDATKGLDVYVQMGAFDDADATTLTIHTNYGDAKISTGTGSVSWSSTALDQKESAEVNDFASAVQAMNAKATTASKVYGQNVAVNVTLNPTSIKASTTVTNQADLDKIIATLESLGQLNAPATIEFSKSDLEKEDGVVAADGDVILTDLSGLNKIKGAIKFQKNGNQTPANVYISGELALQANPAASVNFTVLNGKTLTVSKDLDLGSNNLTVNAGATLVNKAKITAASVTTIATIAATENTPAVPAGLYISEVGADATGISGFTNGGAIEWKGGKLISAMTGVLYANVTTDTDLAAASEAFADVTNSAAEAIIANDLTVATQITPTVLPHIKKMTIKGKVTFNLTKGNAFTFADLKEIDVQSGSFNLTGGNQGTGENDFYAFTANSATCQLSLASGTNLNIAAGTKLDLGTGGSVKCDNATVVNSGWIMGTSMSGTPASWAGSMVGTNPKKQN